MEAAVAVRQRRDVGRWAALGGALFTVLFVIGTLFLYSGAPGGDDPPAKIIAWYSDSGHRDRIHVGWILTGLGIFFLLWFVAALRRAVLAVDGEGILSTVTTIGGTVYAATGFVAIAINDGIRTMSDDTYQHRVFPELQHAADDASYLVHATGGAAMGAMIIAVSLAFMWAGTWRKWVGWLGVVVGILALASILFFTTWLFLLWILVVSILMFLRPAAYGERTTATT
jgi:hypothetical protein